MWWLFSSSSQIRKWSGKRFSADTKKLIFRIKLVWVVRNIGRVFQNANSIIHLTQNMNHVFKDIIHFSLSLNMGPIFNSQILNNMVAWMQVDDERCIWLFWIIKQSWTKIIRVHHPWLIKWFQVYFYWIIVSQN